MTMPQIERPSGGGIFWGIMLFVILILLVIPGTRALHQHLASASRWLDVREIRIEDFTVGEIPRADINRTIRRGTLATRSATIYRQNEAGEFYRFCQRSALIDYRQGQALPPPPYEMTIDFWLDVPPNPQCPQLPAGTYLMVVAWILTPQDYPQKILRIESNVFHGTDPDDPEASLRDIAPPDPPCRDVRVSRRGVIHAPPEWEDGSNLYHSVDPVACFRTVREALERGYRLPRWSQQDTREGAHP